MSQENLIKKAQEFGIENAETLTVKQLEKAIGKAEKELSERKKLVDRAVELGFDAEVLKDSSNEELQTAIAEAEAELEEKEINRKKVELISEFLGIDIEESSVDELQEAIDSKKLEAEELISTETTKTISEEKEIVDPEKGKTKKTVDLNGNKYGFTSKAPAKFRFADVVKTQEEWIQDSDAMELMIQGRLSYVKQIIE